MVNHSRKACILASLPLLVGGCAALEPRPELAIRTIDSQSQEAAAKDALEAGRSLLALGRNADAISAFRKALRDTPGHGDALNGLAIAYDRIGRKDLAQRYFELAVANNPADVRFSENLTRFLHKNGRAAMAANLTLPSPAGQAEVPAEVVIADQNAVTLEDKPLILAALPQEVLPLPAMAQTTELLPASPIDPVNLADIDRADDVAPIIQSAPKIVSRPAVYRPVAPVQIKAAAINPHALPSRPADMPPSEGRKAFIPPLPALPEQPQRRDTVRLERVSLGEVRLVTRADRPMQPASRKMASRPDFDGFGAKLATWLPAAIAKEQHGETTTKAGPALKQALGKIALEQAVTNVDSAPTAEKPKGDAIASYAFFQDEELVVTTLAAL